VCASGDVAANTTYAEAPGTGENFRCTLKGVCNPGDKLALSTDYGKLYAPAGGAGALNVWAIAEEAGVDGQLVLCRRVGPVSVTF
jgi:hypothetical protein